MRIVLFGLGHVGTTMAACLAQAGHDVLGIDVSPAKVAAVAAGRTPVMEPQLDALLLAGVRAGRISAASAPDERLGQADLAVVCVGTPPQPAGGLDLSALLAVAHGLGAAVRPRPPGEPLLLVFRSTVPPGTMDRLLLPALEAAAGEPPGRRYEVAYNPEFLREASAVEDYRAPPKIVVGERARGATRRLRGLYDGIAAPFLEVPFAVAEMAKLVDNGWHALKVAFANEIGRVCVGQGLAPGAVMEILLADTKLNLGPAYLRPGGPYGGSCLPKDVAALLALADEAGLALPLLAGTQASNRHHLDWLLGLIRAKVRPPGPILQLGLSFKAGTDDLRDSPLLALAEALLADGYTLAIHDPDIDLARLTGANQALARGRAAPVLERLGAGLEGAAAARLVLLGKPIPGIRACLPAGTTLLDLTRLEGLA